MLGAIVLGAITGASLGSTDAVSACSGAASRYDGKRAAPERGSVTAILRGSIVALSADGGRQGYRVSASSGDPGVLRHVASLGGYGTAHVEDRLGADVVVADTPSGLARLPQRTEAAHPAWSPGGRLAWSVGSALRLWSPESRRTTRIDAPPGALGIYYPVFTREDTITAVASARTSSPRVAEDSLNDLWSYDLRNGTWTRLTRFRVAGDRWSVIRTPILTVGGRLLFVRVHGSGTGAPAPRFDLWRLDGDRATKVRTLPREMYLAGTMNGRIVWNIFDEASGEWRLYREGRTGDLIDLGCGRVMVDPLAESDPDLGPGQGRHGPTRTESPSPTIVPSPSQSPVVAPSPSLAESERALAILVGDFSTPEAAQPAADRISEVYGLEAQVEIVDNLVAPAAVAPGVWAVVLRLTPDTDPGSALVDFRAKLPEYAGWSWVVTL